MENSVMFRKNGISECVRPSMKKNHIKIYLREIFYLVSTTYGGCGLDNFMIRQIQKTLVFQLLDFD
jgi:hypothetical protein